MTMSADDPRIRLLERRAHVGTMAAGIGHEVRNALTGVLGFAQIAQRRADDPTETRGYLQVIERETVRALAILESFLAAGRIAPQRVAIELNALATSSAQLVRSAFHVGQVEVALDLDDQLGLVFGDADALRQVVLNLAFNAAQAMADGGAVCLSTRAEADAIVLRVADDGPGVPIELRDQIFTPFFTTRADGTGLGLAVSAAIVAEHGGVLALEPSERGATFAMRLPRVVRSAP